MAVYEIANTSYHVDNKLIKHWNKNSLPRLKKKNQDRVYIVDGRERMGKSTWTFQQMGVIEPEIFESPEKFCSRICIDTDEFNETVRKTKNGVVCFDEGFRGFSSRAAISRVNKMLIQTLMEMGQNNNIVFIVLPTFFLLDIYPAMIRSNALFHIRQDKKSKLRMWEGFNSGDKNEIYRQGIKKSWKYKFTPFRGRFPRQFPGGEEFEKAYNKKKQQSFAQMSLSMYKGVDRNDIIKFRGIFCMKTIFEHPEIYQDKQKNRKSNVKLASWLTSQGFPIKNQGVSLLFRELEQFFEERLRKKR